MFDQKKELRKIIKSRFSRYSKEELDFRSKSLTKNLKLLDEYNNANTVLLFYSLPDEVCTKDLLRHSIICGKKLVLPRCIPEKRTLCLKEINNLDTDLEVGAYGIIEPKANLNNIPVDEIDFCCTPGLAFDLKGNRLGRGLGYYDRLLHNTNIIKCGLAMDFQIINTVVIDKHDVKVDMLVTETGHVKCSHT